MSYKEDYLNDIRVQREGLLDKYTQFMDDFVTPQLVGVDNTSGSVVIDKDTLTESGIHCGSFKSWLESEGFEVVNDNSANLIVQIEEVTKN